MSELTTIETAADKDAAEIRAFAVAALGKFKEAARAANIKPEQLQAAFAPLVADAADVISREAPLLLQPIVAYLLKDVGDKLLAKLVADIVADATPEVAK